MLLWFVNLQLSDLHHFECFGRIHTIIWFMRSVYVSSEILVSLMRSHLRCKEKCYKSGFAFLVTKVIVIDGENNCVSIPPNPRRVGYIVSVHGPLYMGSHIHQHPPQSELPAQRCSRLDNKKANTPPPPRSLNYWRSGVQDWTGRKYKGQIPSPRSHN